MEPDAPPLAYALPDAVDAGYERARRVFAWFTLGFAVAKLINDSVYVYQAWPDFLVSWLNVPLYAKIVACLPLAIGAIAFLRGHERGIAIVRWSAFAIWCVGVASIVVWRLTMGLPASAGYAEGARFLWITTRLLLLTTFELPALLFCLSFPLRRAGR